MHSTAVLQPQRQQQLLWLLLVCVLLSSFIVQGAFGFRFTIAGTDVAHTRRALRQVSAATTEPVSAATPGQVSTATTARRGRVRAQNVVGVA